MANEVVLTQEQLQPLSNQIDQIAPNFEEALLGSGIPIQRFKRSIIMSIEKTPKLYSCTRQSLFTAAGTAAILQLECDGTTGQCFLLPFWHSKDKVLKAQCIIGYKGYNTLGARAGCTIQGGVYREGDEFDFELGTHAHIRHRPKLGDESARKVLASYAIMLHPQRPPVHLVLSLDEIIAIKNKAAAGGEGFSPWNDMSIGFPAMAEKSAKRRLHRSMALNTEMDRRYQLAAVMEERHEEWGQHSFIAPGPKLIADGHEMTPRPAPGVADFAPPDFHIVGDDGQKIKLTTKEELKARWLPRIAAARSKKDLNAVIARNKDAFETARKHASAEVDEIHAAYLARLKGIG
jgi:recombination protein RecT